MSPSRSREERRMSVSLMPAEPAGPRPEVVRFISALEDLGPGPRARLKRNAGEDLAGSRGVLPLFYQILPRAVTRPRDVETYFLVATLYGLAPGPAPPGNLARTLREVA